MSFLIRRARDEDRPVLEVQHARMLDVIKLHTEGAEDHPLDDVWFTDTERLFAYVGLVGERVGGYLLVMGPDYAKAMGFPVQAYAHELWVDEDLRGSGLAGALLKHALGELPGTWAVEVLPENLPASRFWARELGGIPSLEQETRNEFLIYRWESAAAPPG